MINADPSPSTTRRPEVIPMRHDAPALVEMSFVDAITLIEAAPDLSSTVRSQWTCSLRQVAKALDRPLELVPARWTALRLPVSRLHHLALGMTAKTLANHKANTRAALAWLSGAMDQPTRGAPLIPPWQRLRDLVSDRGMRARLYGMMRFASAKGVEPEQVDDALVQAYLTYRAETTALAAGVAAQRSLARTWNRCVREIGHWPQQRLTEPDLPSRSSGPEWDDFPEGLRGDLESYLDRLMRIRRTPSGKRVKPCKASTIRTRRAELVAFVRKAVAIGIPLADLNCLSALLAPALVKRVLDAYWADGGAEPKRYTIDLAWKLHSIARLSGCLAKAELDELDDLRVILDEYRQAGLTEKNLAVVRQVLAGPVWREVVRHPDQLMAEARLLKSHAPLKAALRAQLAAAIAILPMAPIRLGNLTRIRLEENLIRPAGPDHPYVLVFPDYDVKNRIKLEFPLDEHVTALIAEYVHDFRPTLLRGSNDRWLFPGENGSHKTLSMFSEQITATILKATGLRLTAHQFRHAAAAVMLREEPGNYEWVRRVLGHKSIQTTINFYIGLETTQAAERFGQIVRKQVMSNLERVEP
jgi:integrase